MSSRVWLIGVFVVLQGLDLLLTWRLLTGRPDVGEANPVALALLERHGWAGMAGLKLASTLVALACVLLVCRTRPRAGRALLAGLCTVLFAVVGYSSVLLARPLPPELQATAPGNVLSATLDDQFAALKFLTARRTQLCAHLVAGELDLPEAARQMARLLRDTHPRLHFSSRVAWPDPEREEQVASFLLYHCKRPAGKAPSEKALSLLREELARHYPNGEWSPHRLGSLGGWRTLRPAGEGAAE